MIRQNDYEPDTTLAYELWAILKPSLAFGLFGLVCWAISNLWS